MAYRRQSNTRRRSEKYRHLNVATILGNGTVGTNATPGPDAGEAPEISYGVAGTQYIEAGIDNALFSPTLIGGDGAESYSIDPEAPLGMTFNTGSGVFSGTPTVVTPSGAVVYEIVPTNATGDGNSVFLSVHVGDAPNPIYIGTPFTLVEGEDVLMSVQDAEGSVLRTFSIEGTGDPLPDGLTLNVSTGKISGTIALGAAGSYDVDIRCVNPWDAVGVVTSVTFNITEAAAWPPAGVDPDTILRAFIAPVSRMWSDVGKTTEVTGVDNSVVRVIEDLSGTDDMVYFAGPQTAKIELDAFGAGGTGITFPIDGSFNCTEFLASQDLDVSSGRYTLYLVFKVSTLTRPNNPESIDLYLTSMGGEGELWRFSDNSGESRFLRPGDNPAQFDSADTDPHLYVTTNGQFAYRKTWQDGVIVADDASGGAEIVCVGVYIGASPHDAVEWTWGATVVVDGYNAVSDGAIVAFLRDAFTDLPNTAPVGLSLTVDEASFPVGQAITPVVLTVATGTADEFDVSPALPTGLTFAATMNPNEASITGTPTTPVINTAYTLTARNGATEEETSIDFTIEVFEPFNPGDPGLGGF